MPLFAKILFNRTKRFRWRFRYFLYFFTGLLAVSFVCFQTEKRILSSPIKPEAPIAQIPSIIENVEEPDSLLITSKSIQKTPVPPIHSVKKKPKEDRERAIRILKESSQDPAFAAFSDWLEEFDRFACPEPVNCVDHDPRYATNLIVRGEILARARNDKFSKLIATNPKQAIELAIPEGISQKLPLNISRHLEKWQNGLIDVKSWHACKSQTHLLCEINQHAIFENGKIFELFSYGNRKNLPTLKGLSAWGVSLGDKFAMSEQAIYSPSNSANTGKLIFAGNELSYFSKAEKNYFEEIVNQAEDHHRRSRGTRKINYPISMGSDGTVQDYLREKYEINFIPTDFNNTDIPSTSPHTYPETPAPFPYGSVFSDLHYAGYTDRPGKKLLQIESQAENDYIVELLKKHFDNTSIDFIWLGATKDLNQTTPVYDRKNQHFRTVLLSSWGATGNNWFWRDGSKVDYSNWALTPGSDSFAALNFRTGMWETQPADSLFPYILEKELPFEIGSIPANLSGTRKILVVPARFEDQTTKMRSSTDSYSGWRLERNHLLTNEFGELINEDVYTEPFEPISRTNLEELMQEVKDFYFRNTDQQLNLIPVFVPTVTIPWRIHDVGDNFGGGGEHQADTSGEETGIGPVDYSKGNPVLDFAEYAMIEAGRVSEEWDFYGPAFVGVAEIKLTVPKGNYTSSSLPLITLEDGAYINTSTLLPHPRFKPAELEPVLNEDGNLSSIRVVDPGAYYFDPEFGSRWDSGGRSIFDYNYTTDDNEPDPTRRSALHEYRDLCQKLDQNSDGIADYNTTSGVEPILLLDGVPLSPSEYSLEIKNVCLTWVGFTNYEQEEEGLAWYGAPGAHILVREGQASSRIVAHEIGHNFGLMHAQRYATKGEQVLSDEGIKVPYGNPYSVMGSAPSISNGMGDLTIAEKSFLFDLYDGQAGYTPGLQKGVDILDINSASDLMSTNLSEIDPVGIPNKFRIYRSNSSVPPLALREANFTLNIPADIKKMLDEYFGEANYSNSPNIPSSAHDFNQTASDLNRSIKLVAVGSGEDVVANLLFNRTANPTLEIVNGGRGFVKEPIFKILEEDNKTELLNINPAWIRELSPLDHLQGQLFNSNLTNRWIRGARISANSSVTKPSGLDVSEPLNNYFLSYRSDISATGLVLLASNNPDINNSYVKDREYFYTRSEAFLLDATPQTPNDYNDAPLLIGSTYSDHDADIHITPTAYGGGQDFEAIKLKIDQKRELVQRLKNANIEFRDDVRSFDTNLANAKAENADLKAQVESQELLISGYEVLELTGTQLYTDAVEQLAYWRALLTLSEAAQSGAEAQLEESFLLLEDNDLQLNLELNKLNELSNSYQIEQDGLFPYIEFVVNIGTVTDGSAQAPSFELNTTSQTPAVGDSINIRAMVTDGNTSAYAYSWFVNEKPFNAPNQLNSPVISTKFSEAGHYVIRAVVSDMKGGIVSRNLIISVGQAEKKNKSLVTGIVRSTDGFLQGARVVINESPVIEHNLSLGGNLRESFYPSGELDPATFAVDGQLAPELTFRRGEIHRFYFDKSLQDYNISFLEKPENTPPRIEIHMLTDPRASLSGSAYYRNPDVNYTTRSAFASYLSNKTGTYLEMLEYLQEHNQTNGQVPLLDLNETSSNNSDYLDLLEYLSGSTPPLTRFNDLNGSRKENEIMNPYPKALLSETNVTKGVVGPAYANELGYITFGGRGYDRNDTPKVDVRRSSIWEDYNSSRTPNASAIAKVDGVGTISPVNAVDLSTLNPEFLGRNWALREESGSREVTDPDIKDDPSLQLGTNTSLPATPDLVVWGSGGGNDDDPLSEVNATVSAWQSGDTNVNVRTLRILNQGKGFEPNSTMAVLHYPRDPFAYWSFDRHETLFEDRNLSRHQPSPAWNRELSGIGDRLKHYWRMDDEVNATTSLLNNETNETAFLNLEPGADAQSTWGLLGNAIELNGTQELNASNVLPDGNFTLSFWTNLRDDLNITLGGLFLNYNFNTKEAELNGLSKFREDIFNEWMHIAVTFDENVSLYVDGRKESALLAPSGRDLKFSNLNGLLDEIKIYDVVLTEPQVRYLSGRNYLDLSGNKYHATPAGVNFLPISPETTADVPNEFSLPNTPVIGTRIMNLGDSFPSEDHGRSLLFDGNDDHLDMSSHLLEFGMPKGTICMWVKTTTSKTSPLFWLSSPLEVTIIEVDENSSETLITPGKFFAMELVNGMPRLGGVTAFEQTSKVNDGEWHHVAASFPEGIIWIDGNQVLTEFYNTTDILFTGAGNPLEFIAEADELYIGKAPDRTQPNVTSTFNGRLDDVIIYDRTLTNHEVTYLYELRRGREQIPRLEAVVDAIGTVEIKDGGAGYRENPDLVFWYGENNETPNDLPAVATDANLPASSNQGSLTFVTDEAQVYSFHEGKASFRQYNNWRMGTENGWRIHSAAAGIGEFGDPDSLLPNLDDIVWTKKLDFVTTIPLPDGRWDKRLYIDYVTMDESLASSSVINNGFHEIDGIRFDSLKGGPNNNQFLIELKENPGAGGVGPNDIFVDFNFTSNKVLIETNGTASTFSREDVVTAVNNSSNGFGSIEIDGIKFTLQEGWPNPNVFTISLKLGDPNEMKNNIDVDINLTTNAITIETNNTVTFPKEDIVAVFNASDVIKFVSASLLDPADTTNITEAFGPLSLEPTAPVNKLIFASLLDPADTTNITRTFGPLSLSFPPYFKPNGLGGFVERPNFEVASPEVHNPDARPEYKATAYGLFFLDHDENDSLSIVDGGSGYDVPAVGFDLTTGWGEPFSILQFMVRGKSFQPSMKMPYYSTYTEREFFNLAKEDWNGTTWNNAFFVSSEIFEVPNQIHTSNDPANSFQGPIWAQIVDGLNSQVAVDRINIGGDPTAAYFVTEITIDANQTDLNKTIGSVSVDSSGFGYAMPIKLEVVGGRPMFDGRIGQTIPAIQEYEAALGVSSIEVTANQDGKNPPNDIQRGQYVYANAEFKVNKIDTNGSLLKGVYRAGGSAADAVQIINPGLGYIPFNTLPKTDPYGLTSFLLTNLNDPNLEKEKWSAAPNPPTDFHLNEYPFVSVSGGGGYGAKIRINEIDKTNGTITEIEVIDGGRGYFNIDPQNKPVATLAASGEQNASLAVRLGGSLKEIPRCIGCSSGIHTDSYTTYSHLEPWIEIWDRGRSETEIDALDASRPVSFPRIRAHAVPKVVDGRITKVVVTNSGTGYIDPVAMVRDIAPKHENYHKQGDNYERTWRCTFLRVTEDGKELECGHTHNGLYPPDFCPGETDEELPFEDENGTRYIATGNEISAWRVRHEDCDGPDQNGNHNHLNVNFLARKCWGTKMSYKLQNPYYRIDGDEQFHKWAPLDAKLSVVSEGGRILKIEVIKEGQDYFSSKLYVEGSGTGVDAIPVFNEFGVNTHVIFDDPRLTNDELDKLEFRSGAGQGFRERPWSWDNAYDSAFGGREKVKVYAWHSEVITDEGGLSHAAWDWNFGDPILNDNLGDQVVAVDIVDPGLYASDFNGSGAPDLEVPTIRIDYNTTVNFHDINGNPLASVDINRSDHDGNGYADFSEAKASTHGTYTITHTLLNHDSIVDFAHTFPELGVFSETPVLEFYDERNLNGWGFSTDYVEESPSDFIRLNQKVAYDPEKELSYIELYVDDRFPNQLFYGLDMTNGQQSRVLPRFGNVITVTESLPGMNWASKEPEEKKKYSYTDANGFYALPNLDPGFYNVAVFMEDQKLQEMTFRPDSNISRISQPLYVPGFPQIRLETDQYGPGKSSLVWSDEARRLSRPATDMSFREEYDQEYRVLKRLDGIGRGFDPASPTPELTIVPDTNNISITPPNIEVKVLVDGSLQLRIIDDENTSNYFPQDIFYVFHNSQINNIDFVETYLYSESNQTFSFGTKAEATPGLGKFILSPNDGNGTNPISVPVSTYEREWNSTTLSWDYLFRERPFQLSTIAYDENGSSVDTSSVQWSVHLEFNSPENNNSRIVLLEDSNGNRGQNATGSQVNTYLFSLLRKGRVEDLEIINGGKNYSLGSLIRLSGQGEGFLAFVDDVNVSTGSIKSIKILSHGEKYSHKAIPYVVDIEGTSAILKPKLPWTGSVKIEANITLPGATSVTTKSILLKPSLKYPLDSLETWRNRYTDSFWSDASDPNWKQQYLTEDPDSDNLVNAQEWSKNTNPLQLDTDGDGLNDDEEILIHSTNPLLPDTDGDGLPDSNETNGSSDPLKYDTDKDGISDLKDTNPTSPDGNGIISGVVVKKTIYDLNATVYFHCGTYAPFPTVWDSNWTKKMNNFYLTGKTPGNYTIRSFIDFQPQNGTYDPGEPYAESNLTLTSSDLEEMGKYLMPTDPPPEIKFFDVPSENGYAVNAPNFMERNVTIDVNRTNSISSFAYAVEASDPYDNITYRDVNVSFILENGLNNPVEFLVDGNFTQYIDLNSSRADFNSSVKFDLNSTPIGKYYLTFRAVDQYGNLSPSIRQNIEIKDTQPPYISLLDLGNAKGITTFSKTELQTVIPEVNFDLNETNNSVVWKWPFGQPFELEDLSEVQSNEGVIIVHVMDTKNEFLTNWSVVYEYNDTIVDPASTREDIDNLNLAFLISDANNTDRIGLHKLKFNATDRSGNQLDFTLYLLINPAYQSTITAVDGYLENARVGFDADGDGISDLNREFRTNIYGRADVLFTAAEFADFDINGNGKLDPQEGKFIVTGGFDTSTGSVFSGKLYADANSTVVSPLTTLISQLMENGLTKKDATARLAHALGLSAELDLTAYDPIQKAFEGDANATLVMLANLRMANLMNQSEGLLRALSEEYEGYKIGTDILDEVANWISSKGNLELLDLENALVDAIPIALAQAGTAGELSIDDQLAMFQLMTDFDSEFLKIDEDLGFEELMTKQITFIEELEDLVADLTDKLPTPKEHSLELNFTDGGVVYGAGDYRYGSKAAIMAVPDNHYKFIKWNGDGLQDVNAASTVVLMTEDRNITALFEQIYYEVAVLSSIGGSVEGAGQYLSGERASLLAIPQEGYKFTHWSGYHLSDPAVPLIDIDVDKSLYITAEFQRVPVSLNLQASTGGHVQGSGDYNYGENVSISAVPDLGYVFSRWTGGSIQDPYAPSTYINLTEHQSLTAKFELAQPGNLTLSVVSFPESGGYSMGSGNHAKGSPVTLTAHSFSGYEFDRWSNEEDNFISNDFSISYTLETHTTLYAHFKPQYHMLEIEIHGQGETNGSGAFMHGENVVISATPETGYLFDRWVGENITNPHLPETTVFIDKSVRIRAVFEPMAVKLAISSNHGGLATGGGSYSLGDIAILDAFPATGYKFSGWTEAGLEERTEERILVEMNGSREIYANFELINNFFTPQGQDFYHHVNIHNLADDLSLLTLLATDGDGTAVTFDLISGNMDLDDDGVGIFKLLPDGKLFLEDMDEVELSASKKLKLIVSISDNGGKTNQLKGIVEIPNLLILNSLSLGNSWYDSQWFGKFFWEEAPWLYHQPLGWMYIHPASDDSFWLWHQKLKAWLWTNKDLFPQAYSGTELKWLYFHLDSQNVRIFDYDHQSWDVLR